MSRLPDEVTDALFTAAEVYDGDPLRPDMETPTPAEIVASLTPDERIARADHLVDQAWDRFPDVIDEIEAIESELRDAGVPEPLCRWGHGEGRASDSSPGLACGNCLVRGQMTFDEGDAA